MYALNLVYVLEAELNQFYCFIWRLGYLAYELVALALKQRSPELDVLLCVLE